MFNFTIEVLSVPSSPERLLNFSNVLYIVAAIFSFLTTSAVVYFGHKVGQQKERELAQYQSDAAVRISEANREAARATEKSEEARANAERARADAAQAYGTANAAQAEAEESKRGRLRVEVRLQELLLENARQTEKIDKLKNAAKPRQLSEEEISSIISALREIPDKVPVDLRIVSRDFETLRFAKQIEDVLRGSGFSVIISHPSIASEGFGVATTYLYPTPEVPLRICETFRRAGVSCLQTFDTTLSVHEFFVFVGSKPATAP